MEAKCVQAAGIVLRAISRGHYISTDSIPVDFVLRTLLLLLMCFALHPGD